MSGRSFFWLHKKKGRADESAANKKFDDDNEEPRGKAPGGIAQEVFVSGSKHSKLHAGTQPPDEAINFLNLLRPAPWVLVGIIPDGTTLTITAYNAAEVGAFVKAHDGKRNLYYSVNPTLTAMCKAGEGCSQR